ncbi:MAG: TonB family protein [Rhizobiales bacterium]|nr:TonB family protein [Hyphomicrobiales bacterium]
MIAFRHRETGRASAGPPVLLAGDRPAPPGPRRGNAVMVLLLIGSVAVHAAVIAAFDGLPRQVSSAGIPAISVDIVIGDNSAAGVASMPGQESAIETKPAETVRAEETGVTSEPVKPVTVAEAATRSLPATAERESPSPEAAAPATEQPPSEQNPEAAPTPAKPAYTVTRAEDIPPAAHAAVRNRQARPRPSSAASGVGRGGATALANYHGRVAAHLARHKRFPAAARRRGEHGNAGIDFSIDGSGRVVSVRITRSSGFASLDQAAEAMVWRASPFPTPPNRAPRRFSVPVSYAIR